MVRLQVYFKVMIRASRKFYLIPERNKVNKFK